jgi:D-sedoheptulose 7-phosphate isomerase
MRDIVLRKAAESRATQEAFFAANADRIAACATAMAEAFARGAKLFAMGNGGSACDAQHLAVEFVHPVLGKRAPLPAIALSADAALLSAVGNDGDYALVFADQLRLLARPGDLAIAISTSGKSASIQRALQTARELGLVTIGFSGRDGGRMPELCEHCFTVPSFSIHRIQEAHGALLHVLWDLIHLSRGEEDLL